MFKHVYLLNKETEYTSTQKIQMLNVEHTCNLILKSEEFNFFHFDFIPLPARTGREWDQSVIRTRKDINGIRPTIPDKCERVNGSLPCGSWSWRVAVDALQKTVVILLVNVCSRRCNDITQKKQVRAESVPKIKIRLQTLDYKDQHKPI